MTSLPAALWRRTANLITYRGREGQWSWVLHRLSGLGVVLFLLLHVLDIWLIGLGREAFEGFLVIYTHPIAKVMEVFLIFGLIFHAVNGARIIVIDFWPGMTRYQRQLVYIEAAIVLLVVVPAAWVTLSVLLQ